MRSLVWAGLELRVTPIAGVGVALRPVEPIADRTALPALGRQLWELCCRAPVRIAGVDEIVASDVELLVQTPSADLDALLLRIGEALVGASTHRPLRFRLPVCFELATDWKTVSAHTGLGPEQVIARLLDGVYTLGMYGFLPGFAYLLGLDEDLRCPRRDSPRARVEAGSVALGGDYLGVYGVPSPGGWQIVGRTPLTLFSLRSLPPLMCSVGDELVLERIDATTFDALLGRRLADPAFALDRGSP